MLTVLFDLDLTGPDNLHVEIFDTKGSPVFIISKLHALEILGISLILTLVIPSLIKD